MAYNLCCRGWLCDFLHRKNGCALSNREYKRGNCKSYFALMLGKNIAGEVLVFLEEPSPQPA